MRAERAYLNSFLMREVVKADLFVDPLARPSIKDPNRVLLLEGDNSFFTKPSPYHGRSVEDPHGLVIRPGPIRDENGDLYTTFTIKGADATYPLVGFNGIEPNGVRIIGMLDASIFDRCVAVSKQLRKAGVLTEWPIFLARPTQFPDSDGDDMGLLAFKRKLYNNYLEAEKERVEDNNGRLVDGIGKVGAVGGGLLDMQFGVMYRGTLSNIRLAELNHIKEPNQKVSEAIKALQLRKPDYFLVWDDLEKLDPESPEDQATYLVKVLPSIMGENLARLHNAGCYHKYLHPGNWTLAGEIVDLDSVRSASLNLHPDDISIVTMVNRFNEVNFAADALKSIIDSESDDIYLPLLESFATSYFAERYLGENVTELESILLESHFLIQPDTWEDLTGPRIIKLTDEPLISKAVNVLQQLLSNSSGTINEETIFTCMKIQLGDDVDARISDYLKANGLDPIPPWLMKDQLVSLELNKLYVVLLDTLKSAGYIVLIDKS